MVKEAPEFIQGEEVTNAPFIAEKGKGAFLNGKKIQVSEVNKIEKSYLLSCQGGERDNKRIAKINSVIYQSQRT